MFFIILGIFIVLLAFGILFMSDKYNLKQNCKSVNCKPVNCKQVASKPVDCNPVDCNPVDCNPVDCKPVKPDNCPKHTDVQYARTPYIGHCRNSGGSWSPWYLQENIEIQNAQEICTNTPECIGYSYSDKDKQANLHYSTCPENLSCNGSSLGKRYDYKKFDISKGDGQEDWKCIKKLK